MLGLTQLCILLAIKAQTDAGKAVDPTDLREQLKTALGINSSEQITITINRLLERGFLKRVKQTQLKYVSNKKNNEKLEQALALCRFALGQ